MKPTDDLEMDVQTVMARIRESMVEGPVDDDVEFPTYTRARRGGSPTLFPEELYYQLEQANLNYDQVLVELSLVESQMPLLGALVNRFKRELHQLVVYYVNMVAERQVTVNDALVHTLNQLVDRLESPPDQVLGSLEEPATERSDVESLQRQVDELRERLASLEAQMKKAGAGNMPPRGHHEA